MDSVEITESSEDGLSENEFRRKEASSKERSINEASFIPPRTPEALIITTPTKLNNDSSQRIREDLQTTLEKHGIVRENARDFFRGLVKDKDFQKLFIASMNSISDESQNDSNDDEFEAGPMTRSRLKDFIQNSPHKVHWVNKVTASEVNLPKFADIPLPDNDDEDDEYKPIHLPAEDSFDFEFNISSHCGLGTSKNNAFQEGLDDSNRSPPPLLIDTQDDPAIQPQGVQSDVTKNVRPDVISKRTRSKHSLESTSLDVLEAAFNPPDVIDNMRDNYIQNIEDYDWQKWLSDLMKSDFTAKNNDDDNVDEDPDFNEMELELSENEEFNDSAALEVPKSELRSLLEELQSPENFPRAGRPASSTPITKTLPLHEIFSKKRPSKHKKDLRLKSPSEVYAATISPSQLELIEQQMQQHVQLLLQANLLCRNTEYEDVVRQSGEWIHELHHKSTSLMRLLGLQKSYLYPCNLQESLGLINKPVPPSCPIMRLHKAEKMKRHVPLPSHVAEALGNTEACMYPELLPISAPLTKMNPRKMPSFLYAEDCLLVLGLSEMKDLHRSKFELIREHMLPMRTATQLSARHRNVVYCRNTKDMHNPITKYHKHGEMPSPNTRVKTVFPSDARKPVNMIGEVPCWVHALKPIYQTKQTETFVHDSNKTLDNTHKKEGSIYESQCAAVGNSESITVVSSISLNSCTSTSKPITLQTNQISVFQTYYSVNDVNCTLRMKTNELRAVSTDTSNTVNHSVNGANTLTSQSSGMVTTSKVQPTIKYGRRKSAGKSIKRMRKELLSSSSSSESEDDSKIGPKTQRSGLRKTRVGISIEDSGGEDKDNMPVEESRESSKRSPNITKAVERSNEIKQVPPVGGYLQKLHPRLLSKKSKISCRDAVKIKSSAQMIKNLEDDVNVLSDPRHDEKEKIFATGYLARVKLALQPQPGKYEHFISILNRFTDGCSSPVDIFRDITNLLTHWPDLVQGFVPFLSPDQAQECGLAHEKCVYVRARRFLRQLELQFADNQEHLDRILNVLNSFSKTAIYREEEMLNSILNLLKGYPYLQDEFVTFFDSQPPPKMLFDEDFEEVDLTDDTIKDPNAGQFEHVTLPADSHDNDPITIETAPPVKKSKKHSISQCSTDEPRASADLPPATENKENIYPGMGALQDMANFDSESDDVMTEDEANPSSAVGIPPPNVAFISEDAQSSSPFKRITGEVESLRPKTPTGIAEITSDTILFSGSSFPPCLSSNSNFPVLPPTPGKIPIAVRQSLTLQSKVEHQTMGESNADTRDDCVDQDNPVSDSPPPATPQPSESETKVNDPSCTSPASSQKISNPAENTDESVDKQPALHQAHVEDNVQSLDHHKDKVLDTADEVATGTDEKWTRNEDEVLLTTCRQGISEKMFLDIAKKLGRSVSDVEARLRVLCDFFDESEEDVDVCSDSSAS